MGAPRPPIHKDPEIDPPVENDSRLRELGEYVPSAVLHDLRKMFGSDPIAISRAASERGFEVPNFELEAIA
jgi:hypothetical protein